ncbi:hypothetical protein DPMN_166284 [Dreissena polymorpha]|uniref:Uncharacterized protein n=1 Tax=Dreissena polymorpha TaxID=45954 RepID=A0A9D4IXG0_DREPO|nr:hypothetical protein DPMN_166284 [Dreissena polymorpha]
MWTTDGRKKTGHKSSTEQSDLVDVPADNLPEVNKRTQRNSNSKSIKLATSNTEIYKNSFIPRTIQDWNSLPDSRPIQCNIEGTHHTLDNSEYHTDTDTQLHEDLAINVASKNLPCLFSVGSHVFQLTRTSFEHRLDNI